MYNKNYKKIRKRNNRNIIQVTSNEAKIIANIIEKGSSISKALKVVNKYCYILNEEESTISNVTSLLR